MSTDQGFGGCLWSVMNDQRGSGSRWQMTKRLIVMVAVIPLGVPANAASPFPFAHDDAGRPVLEFYPAQQAGSPNKGSIWCA
jgi:hypothetical protein